MTTRQWRTRPEHRRWAGLITLGACAGLILAGCALPQRPVPAESQTAVAPARGPVPAGSPAANGTAVAPGPDAPDAPSSPDAPGSPSTPDPARPAIPGMYGLGKVGGAVRAGVVTIATPQSCSFVMQVLEAGQWRVTDTVTKDGKDHSWYDGQLRMGSRTGVFGASQTPSGCAGSISVDQQVPARLSGAITASGSADFLQIMCKGGYDDSDTTMPAAPDSFYLMGLFGIAGHWYLAFGDLRNTAGSRTVKPASPNPLGDDSDDSDDPAGMGLVAIPDGIAEPDGALAAYHYMEQVDAAATKATLHGSDPSSWPVYVGGSGATETITVTSQDPLRATITARGLRETAHPNGKSLGFTLPFSCVP